MFEVHRDMRTHGSNRFRQGSFGEGHLILRGPAPAVRGKGCVGFCGLEPDDL